MAYQRILWISFLAVLPRFALAIPPNPVFDALGMSTFDRIRINFTSIPGDPCRVKASFLDSSGAVLKTAQLDLGIDTTSFTFDSSDVPASVVELENTGRLRVHVSLIPGDPCK